MSHSDPTVPRRFIFRHLRFSLLSLLILTTVCCLLAAWLFRPQPVKAISLVYLPATYPLFLPEDNPQFPGDISNPHYQAIKDSLQTIASSGFPIDRALKEPKVSAAVASQIEDGSDPKAWLKSRLSVEYPANGEILRWTLIGNPNSENETTIILDGLVEATLSIVMDNDRRDYVLRLEKIERRLSGVGFRLRKSFQAAESEDQSEIEQAALQEMHELEQELRRVKQLSPGGRNWLQVLQPATIVDH